MNLAADWFRKILDLVLPRKASLRVLESLSAYQFWQTREKADWGGEEIIFALFQYRDPVVQTAIWQIKYRRDLKIVSLLAAILHDQILAELEKLSQFSNFIEPILIPIPMSAGREKARGHNQAEDLAQEIARVDDGRHFELLTKVLTKNKETSPQTSLSRALRLKNMSGVFNVNNHEKILGRNIILIDDVVTTGATIKEARATMIKAGARKVIAFVVAH